MHEIAHGMRVDADGDHDFNAAADVHPSRQAPRARADPHGEWVAGSSESRTAITACLVASSRRNDTRLSDPTDRAAARSRAAPRSTTAVAPPCSPARRSATSRSSCGRPSDRRAPAARGRGPGTLRRGPSPERRCWCRRSLRTIARRVRSCANACCRSAMPGFACAQSLRLESNTARGLRGASLSAAFSRSRRARTQQHRLQRSCGPQARHNRRTAAPEPSTDLTSCDDRRLEFVDAIRKRGFRHAPRGARPRAARGDTARAPGDSAATASAVVRLDARGQILNQVRQAVAVLGLIGVEDLSLAIAALLRRCRRRANSSNGRQHGDFWRVQLEYSAPAITMTA